MATSVFAGTGSSSVTNGSNSYGSVYINAKTSSIYAETSANSSGSNSSDYVYIYATDCGGLMHTGASYTTAYVSANSGSYSGTKYANGAINRNGIRSTGNTSAVIG